MKKLHTLTELDILRAACAYYLDAWNKEQERAEKSGGELAKARAAKAWERLQEISAEVVRQERKANV